MCVCVQSSYGGRQETPDPMIIMVHEFRNLDP